MRWTWIFILLFTFNYVFFLLFFPFLGRLMNALLVSASLHGQNKLHSISVSRGRLAVSLFLMLFFFLSVFFFFFGCLLSFFLAISYMSFFLLSFHSFLIPSFLSVQVVRVDCNLEEWECEAIVGEIFIYVCIINKFYGRHLIS